MNKKICFFLQRRFAYLGHAMAYNILKEPGISEVCAYAALRSSFEFLKKQTDVKYSGLILDEDIHAEALKLEKIDFTYLDDLEKKYGLPNLWPYLYLDRVMMNGQLIREYPYNEPTATFEEMLKCLEHTAKTLELFLDAQKPDALVFSVVGSLSPLLLYHMGKKRGIKTICIDLTRIKNGVAFSDDYKTFSWVDSLYTKLERGDTRSKFDKEAKKFIATFRNEPTPYYKELRPDFNNQVTRRANLLFLRPKQLIWALWWHLRQLYLDLTQKNRDYTDILVWWIAWDKLKRKARGLIGYDNYWEEVRQGEDYAFYPLHYETETATLLYAPLYTNQVELIRQSARALPVGMYLYVKEHPRMIGYRSRRFYKHIKKIPNVRLVKPTYYGPTLVKNAKIVITITSTSGWEGVMFGKPVITFGDIYYNKLPNVARCRSFEDLAELIKDKLDYSGHNEKSLENYVAALMEDSVDVDYIDLWAYPDEKKLMDHPGMVELATALAKKIRS